MRVSRRQQDFEPKQPKKVPYSLRIVALQAPVIDRPDGFPETIREEIGQPLACSSLKSNLAHKEAGAVNSKQIFSMGISFTNAFYPQTHIMDSLDFFFHNLLFFAYS